MNTKTNVKKKKLLCPVGLGGKYPLNSRRNILMDERVSSFSWDKKHRGIHVEALLHFFDSNKKDEKFESPPRLKKPTQSDNPSSEKADIIPQKDEVVYVTNLNFILSAWLIKNGLTFPSNINASIW